ncbi:MAG: nuclear transport factor 2 family protein [Gemmatimonadaceae bacterium]|nr:nuclear transport factor 2 family protein [Gloeobacterales cyanobacterium ES-bin-141]
MKLHTHIQLLLVSLQKLPKVLYPILGALLVLGSLPTSGANAQTSPAGAADLVSPPAPASAGAKQAPQKPPSGGAAPELIARVTEMVSRMDQAASSKDIQALLGYYGQDFRSDGLKPVDTRQAITGLWAKLQEPVYRTEVESITEQKGQVVVTGTTRLQAVYSPGVALPTMGVVRLSSVVGSVSRFDKTSLKLVAQEIRSERTTITAGTKSPVVNLTIPASVRPGQDFKVEAVLEGPLDEGNPALGGISLIPLNMRTAAVPDSPSLEPLRAGGIFKTAKAPGQSEDQVVTLAFIRTSGLVLISQRLKVTTAKPPTTMQSGVAQ